MKVEVKYQRVNDDGAWEDVKDLGDVRAVKVEQRHDTVHNVFEVIIRDTREYV